MRPLRGELFDEAALERLQARTEVAGDEGAGRVAMDQAGVAQEAAMDEAGRLRPTLRSPASSGSKRARLRPHRRRSSRRRARCGWSACRGRRAAAAARRRRSSSGSRSARGRRRHGRPVASSDSRRPRRRGRGVPAPADATGRRPRRRRRARRRWRRARRRRREARRARREGRAGLRVRAAAANSVSRTNDISGFGAILRAAAARSKAAPAPSATAVPATTGAISQRLARQFSVAWPHGASQAASACKPHFSD